MQLSMQRTDQGLTSAEREKMSDGIALYMDHPAIQGPSSYTGTLQLYRDAPARQVSGAEVAAGGKMGPVYTYRHPLLLR